MENVDICIYKYKYNDACDDPALCYEFGEGKEVWLGLRAVGSDGSVVFMGGKYAMMVCDACENRDSKVDMIREIWLCHVWEKVGSWWRK